MNTTLFSTARLACAVLFFFLLAGVTAHAADGTLKLEAQLVVGSNVPQTNSPPVSPQVEKKLKRLPLKWSLYYVMGSQQLELAKGESKNLVLGGSEMVVRNLGGQQVELTMIDRGTITQSLNKGHTLVTNVKAENSFVVLRQME
jgi:hypothetical protein